MIHLNLFGNKFILIFFSLLLLITFQNCGTAFQIPNSDNEKLNTTENDIPPIVEKEDIAIDPNAELSVYARSLQVTQGEDFYFTFKLNKPHNKDTSLKIKTYSGSAIRGLDFISVNDSITIPAGQTSVTLKVLSLIPKTYSENKEFYIKIESASEGKIAQEASRATIQNKLKLLISNFNRLEYVGTDKICGIDSENYLTCIYESSIAPNYESTKIPTPVAGLNKVRQYKSDCAVSLDDQVYCWGKNTKARVGVSINITDVSNPTLIQNLGPAESIASFNSANCALLKNGTVKCWGNNSDGLLGIGSNLEYSESPALVSGLSSIKGLYSAYYSFCAISNTGGIYCWGRVGKNFTLSNSPVKLYENIEIKQIAGTPYKDLCLLLYNGSVICQDNNSSSSSMEFLPVQEINNAISIHTDIFANRRCVFTSTGEVKCWGANMFGALGFLGNHFGGKITTPQTIREWSGAKQILVSSYNTCALMPDTSLKCMGIELLNSEMQYRNNAFDLPGSNQIADFRVFPYGDICAKNKINQINCWRPFVNSSDFTLESPLFEKRNNDYIIKPVLFENIEKLDHLYLGYSESNGKTLEDFKQGCFVKSGKTYCWGKNESGQLGNGSTVDSSTPVEVFGLTNVNKLRGYDGSRMCAITNDKKVKCWGVLGTIAGTFYSNSSSPIEISGLSDVEELYFDYLKSYYLDSTGKFYNLATNSLILENLKRLDVKSNCALHKDLTVSCWNYDASSYQKITNLSNVKEISSNRCFVITNGTVQCLKKTGSTETLLNVPGISNALGIINNCLQLGNTSEIEKTQVRCFMTSDLLTSQLNKSILSLNGFSPLNTSSGSYFIDSFGRLRTLSAIGGSSTPFNIYVAKE